MLAAFIRPGLENEKNRRWFLRLAVSDATFFSLEYITLLFLTTFFPSYFFVFLFFLWSMY